MKKSPLKKRAIVSATLVLGLIAPMANPNLIFANNQDIVNFRIIGTTDIHANVVNFDYYNNGVTNAFGLSKAATLINQARTEVPNSLLVDNGDTIQGSPLGDYVENKGLVKPGYVHPVMRAMNLLNYDAATPGNHEFNYGMEFLDLTLKGAEFPWVNGNVYDKETGKNYFTPYTILERQVVDMDGETHTLKVGVTGFVPPQILSWDKKHLEGKLVVEDIVKSAKEIVPQMKAAGADVVVVLSHSGIAEFDHNKNLKAYSEGMENAGYYLSQVEGIDAIVTGHQHQKFPLADNKVFPNGNGFDNEKGTVNGVPTIMPGSWGDNLGLIDLTIEKKDGKWAVTESKAQLRPIVVNKESVADSNKEIEEAVKVEHEATIQYMASPVGELKGDLNTFFALVQDNASMEIVNRAQKAYVEKALKGTEYEGIPVLSAAAPFKAGRGGVDNYTNVSSGTITIKNIADLYLYDNNVVTAIKVKGSDIKEWLEWSAGQFNQIDPNSTEEQNLINSSFPTYNFDVIDGVTYEIDITEPAKYDNGQAVINPTANRIKNLKFDGKALDPNMEFVVATNDYRASTGKLVNPGGVNTILNSPDSNRQAVMEYVVTNKVVDASVNNNWKFSTINGKVNVTFPSNPKGEELAKQVDHITYTGKTDDKGFGIFSIDLSGPAAEEAKTPAPVVTPAPVQVSAQVPAVAAEKTHVVQKGENLWAIAKKHYGKGSAFTKIVKANQGKIKAGFLIQPGQQLLIP
ncbi:bifunctional 2',3'-cyclic-nucleotide 2'-phosphodiesterase/3'-nucleotidase [Ammoniphilus sp. CFH 90114]|uniref:bifunctional 2',3'-cyclic-nucleotide 2'-phosphodiesterase/3'-nucleotidase n=1 Tax=Ammoniphilus sp. CFH 90114 TaxID=2493665 RepID=UPI00100F4DEB|nr:bifunctional 2',3'-cyclic-nucleotide 2'-phosphodiesterase/3'-nucleotidase [Ammoniphilus sp. CFH 90114]RXT08972.1 bifunctional 2',3'-cyclic-nucleotide 2'-phosphodiesterase/3'-nucleotidase [Ammoniphilus sp. CFH 90114]